MATGNTAAPKPVLISLLKAEEFLEIEISAKEPLIEGLLCRRDIVALAGRRRHGKTSFITNLATALAQGRDDFLGYSIPSARRVLVYYFEDDSREIQDTLRKLLTTDGSGGNFALRTKDDFFTAGTAIRITDDNFVTTVQSDLDFFKPDIVIFDNLAHLIDADYNDSQKIHSLVKFTFRLVKGADCAVVIAAHPRKRGPDQRAAPSLRDNSEAFFEEIMGSSHFINSCGSLWGLERNISTNRSYFLGGTQRLTGEQSISTLELGENGWFHVVEDFTENKALALNTDQRSKAWGLLPNQTFKYVEAVKSVKPAMVESTFNAWWNRHLLRLKLVVEVSPKTYVKANLAGTVQQTPM
jgi:hypothetical protein